MNSSTIAVFSKFYEPLSLLLLTLTRFFIAKVLDGHPEPASLVFPMLTLTLFNRPTKLFIILAHFYLTQYLLYGTFDPLWAPTGLIMFAVVESLRDKHVIVLIAASNLAAQLFLFSCDQNRSILGETAAEIGYSILMVFLNGPLKVYLEVKEGKTSLKKMVEDYEDERTLAHKRFGVKRADVLPTGVRQRTNRPAHQE